MISYCDFRDTGSGRLICDKCGYPSRKRVVRNCKGQCKNRKDVRSLTEEDWPCIYRSEEPLEEMYSPRCGNRGYFWVYQCQMHGKCSMRGLTGQRKIKACLRCDERVAFAQSSPESF